MTQEPHSTHDPPDREDTTIRCRHCGIEFTTDGQLENHLQRVHGESGP
jgi:hypothetical protein